LRKGYQPAVHLKAIYDLSLGVKNKNPIMQQRAVESLQDLAKKDIHLAYGFGKYAC
jgi:hypothetical protein